jgi:hypothetical protein
MNDLRTAIPLLQEKQAQLLLTIKSKQYHSFIMTLCSRSSETASKATGSTVSMRL